MMGQRPIIIKSNGPLGRGIDTLDLFSAILSAVGGGGNGTGKIFLFLLHRLTI
jgi:hypothetical protein